MRSLLRHGQTLREKSVEEGPPEGLQALYKISRCQEEGERLVVEKRRPADELKFTRVGGGHQSPRRRRTTR